MDAIVAFVVVAKVVGLVLGGLLTHLALRAYRRTGSPALRAVAVGFGVVTFGLALGGGLDRVLGFEFMVGVLAQSVLLVVGFAVIAYSLYLPDDDLFAGRTRGE